jgi:hydroxymethylpyrimidine/phosphomethylpyrimidine kinase
MTSYRGLAATIAGSDSGGGAGIQADLKTFAALDVFGTTVITALTAQNSLGVEAIFDIPPSMIRAQIDAIWSDFPIGAAKTGMLSRPETIREVTAGVRRRNITSLVVDPVMVAQSGAPLIADEAVEVLRNELLPLALLVTPNVPEAERLAQQPISSVEDMRRAAERIAALGVPNVLVKGGHLPQENEIVDVLFVEGTLVTFRDSRLETRNTHGTGCTLSAAITAELASGSPLILAVEEGRRYLRRALEYGFRPGKGWGTLGHARAGKAECPGR